MATKRSTQAAQTGGLAAGDAAPNFELAGDAGEPVKLSKLLGKKVILYFYPKDDTPGCTVEACSFRDNVNRLTGRGAVVLGVSPDSVASHKKFKEKFGLTFPLLADVEKQVVNAYGVWKEKSMYGRTYMGVERTTFIIDERGRIATVFPKVKVDGHVDAVLQALA